MRQLLILCLLGAMAMPLGAANVEGVEFPERIDAGGAALVLNGAGLRSRFVFNVYAMGLYVGAKQTTAQGVIELAGPKRIVIRMLRTVSAAEFAEALVSGLEKNHDGAQFKALAPGVARLNAIMAELKEAKEGMAITLDWAPARGLQVLANDKPAGGAIADAALMRGLLRVWLGDNPVQDDLRAALLGAKGR